MKPARTTSPTERSFRTDTSSASNSSRTRFFVWNEPGFQAARASRLQAGCGLDVADHHRDLRVQATGFDIVGDGLEIRAAARQKNAEAPVRRLDSHALIRG